MTRGRVLAFIVAVLAVVACGFLTGRAIASSDFFTRQFAAQDPRVSEPATTVPQDPVSGTGDPEPGTESPEKPEYWIDVDIATQTVRIMQGEKAVKEMLASTGVEGHETPTGTFEIQNRGTWFYNEKYKQGAKYWVSFKDWGIYLFHSLAMDKNQHIIPEEAEKLGQPASHGCIRLRVEDAKWIYDNIPERTKVVIH